LFFNLNAITYAWITEAAQLIIINKVLKRPSISIIIFYTSAILLLPYQTSVMITYQLSSLSTAAALRELYSPASGIPGLGCSFLPGVQSGPPAAHNQNRTVRQRGTRIPSVAVCVRACVSVILSVCVYLCWRPKFFVIQTHDTLHRNIKCYIKDRLTFRCTRNLLSTFLAVFLYVRSVFFFFFNFVPSPRTPTVRAGRAELHVA